MPDKLQPSRKLSRSKRALKVRQQVDYPRPLRPSEILGRDLTQNPPEGFPALTRPRALFVCRRIAHPAESWRQSHLHIGAAGTETYQHAPDVCQYLAALSEGTYLEEKERGQDPAAKRAEIMSTLARDAVSAPTARERAFSGKVYLDECTAEPERAKMLSDLSDAELAKRLQVLASAVREHETALAPFQSLDIPGACGPAILPPRGSDAGRADD